MIQKSVLSSAVLLLALFGASCAINESALPPEPLFETGSDQELALVQDLTWDFLATKAPSLGLDLQDFQAIKVWTDDLGMAHTRLAQRYQGVPVFGAQAIVHFGPDGALQSFTDSLQRDIQVDTSPAYTAEEALDIAVYDFGGYELLTADPEIELVVLRHENVDYLAYRVQLARIDGTEATSRPLYFIDAHQGDVVWSFENLHTDGAATGSGRGYYSGTVSLNTYLKSSSYYMEDTTRKLGTYTANSTTSSLYYLTDTDNAWTTSTQYIPVEAHYASRMVWDYYYNTFGRSGLNGSGGPGYISSITGSGTVITVIVNYGSRYTNAFWDGSAVYLGDGDGSSLGPTASLDIIGHEMTHAVTEDEVYFTYSGESGGLDEAYADIFAAMVERYAEGGTTTGTWYIGEDTYTPSVSGDALRYMFNPAADGYSADYYGSTTSRLDPHYSSGIGYLAFYLLSQGGSHPTRGGTAMTGIGPDAASQIFYRALTTYLTSSSNFAAARTATLSAATDLYGATSTQYTAVANAWAMVGVGSTGGGSTTGCSGYTYTETGSLARSRASAYETSSSGFSVTSSGTHSASLSGPSTADFDLYLQKKSGSRWTSVASSTGDTSTETISYSGTSGTYRYQVYSYSGSGSYTLCYSKP